MYERIQMRKHMKPQLTLLTIMFIVMGCNNSPDAQQTSNQHKQQNETTVSTITEDVSEKMRISDDILAIDQKIADLENQEKLRLSNEINLIQEKLASLEIREIEIDSAINKLETEMAASKVDSTTVQPQVVLNTPVKKETPIASKSTVTSQQVASVNPSSVHSWGDWANGIKPAAGPSPVAVALFDVEKPNVNFRPNEHSAFYRSVGDNIVPPAVLTAQEIAQLTNAIANEANVITTPTSPASTTGPATGGF